MLSTHIFNVNSTYPGHQIQGLDSETVYTDQSKDAQINTIGYAIIIPSKNFEDGKRTSNHISILSIELVEIHMAVQWDNHNNIKKLLIQ